jgi:formylmethanofuran dehydrogenase subunit C
MLMDAALLVPGKKAPATLAASSRFKGYGNEPLHETRILKPESGPMLDAMKKAWAECYLVFDSIGEEFIAIDGLSPSRERTLNHQKTYDSFSESLKGHVCSAKDIEAFSIFLERLQGEEMFSTKAGLYLSALINYSGDAGFVIHTSHLPEPIHGLGYRNKKNIIVDGDAGYALGESMESGSIIVKGDTGNHVGSSMKGGSITVEGDAMGYLGSGMENGIISVEGNAGEKAGSWMRCGSISIGGNAGDDIGMYMTGGKIIVRGAAGYNAGKGMKGGSIIVEGDVEKSAGNGMSGGTLTVGSAEFVGKNMDGGEIHVLGDLFSLGVLMKRGKIFHKDELVFDK